MYQHIEANESQNDLKPRDSLRLAAKQEIGLLLANEGSRSERVIFSENVIKFNAKGKQQRRVLMITQEAVYNLKPRKLNKSKRRIRICDIGMMTLSALSPEFAIHVPSEYDYHFISKHKQQIAQLLQELYAQQTKSKLIVMHSELKHLKDIVLTKKLAKFESRNSKHVMQQTISDTKDILKKMEEDPASINIDPTMEEFQGMQIVYSPVKDNDDDDNEDYVEANDDNNHNEDYVAVYQSLVYGNHQLLLKQKSKLHNMHTQ